MRRVVWAGLAVVAVITGLAALAMRTPAVQDRLFERAIDARAGLVRSDFLTNDSLNVVLCGTGSPMPDPTRAQACTAVIAGGHFFLFDTGTGSAEQLAQAQLPMGALSGVVFTHLHSDHISGLYDVVLQSWAAGRRGSLDVYGPAGVDSVTGGYETAFALDAGYRTAHHGGDLMPPSGADLVPATVSVPDDNASAVLFDRDGFKITAFRVDHTPIEPAHGYRIDYRDRAVIISGDTVKHPNMVRFGRDADVMVHEALAPHMVSVLADGVGARVPHVGGILRDTLDYHASPVEAAETANEAGVPLLVYSHIVPPLPNAIMEAIFLRGVDEVRPDGVVLGFDGLLLEMPAGSDEIRQADLN